MQGRSMNANDTTEHDGLKYCRQCRKYSVVADFVNRTQTGYCIVCRQCRDRQLERYYEKRRGLSDHTIDRVSKVGKEHHCTQRGDEKKLDTISSENGCLSEDSSTSTVGCNRYEVGKHEISRPEYNEDLSFLDARCKVLSRKVVLSERQDIYIAKVLYHFSYKKSAYRKLTADIQNSRRIV